MASSIAVIRCIAAPYDQQSPSKEFFPRFREWPSEMFSRTSHRVGACGESPKLEMLPGVSKAEPGQYTAPVRRPQVRKHDVYAPTRLVFFTVKASPSVRSVPQQRLLPKMEIKVNSENTIHFHTQIRKTEKQAYHDHG